MDLTVTEAAKAIGATRKTLSSLLNRRSGFLKKVFVRSPEGWLKLQLQYDLWIAEQNTDLKKQPDFFRISDKLLLIKVLK